MSLVSLIVPIYNAEKYLFQCLNSIKNQSYSTFEVLLINDGSTDSSKEVCDHFLNDSRFKYFSHKNSGASFCRNKGIELAQGEFILFVDSDDLIHPKLLQNCIFLLHTYKADGIIFRYSKFESDSQVCYIDENFSHLIMSNREAIESMLYGRLFRGLSANKFYKRSQIIDLKFPVNRKYGEDSYFTYYYLERVERLVYIDTVMYYYRNNMASMLNKDLDESRLQILDTYAEIVWSLKENHDYNLYKLGLFSFNVRVFDILKLLKCYDYNLLFLMKLRIRPFVFELLRNPLVSKGHKFLYIMMFISSPLFYKFYSKVLNKD